MNRVRIVRWLSAFSVALLVGAPVAISPVATAATRPVADDNATAPPPPVQVRVNSLEPRQLAPDSTIAISGQLTNTSANQFDRLRLQLSRGTVIQTRGELQHSDTVAPATGSAACDIVVLGSNNPTENPPPQQGTTGAGPQPADSTQSVSLPAGKSVPFHYECPASQLGLNQIGVYPLALTVSGSDSVTQVFQQLGAAHTYLPSFPEKISGKTRVSWLLPLIDRPHRVESDTVFIDDELGQSIQSGGRLDRLVAMAEQTSKQSPYTLVVDPDLIDSLRVMANKKSPYQVKTSHGLTRGTGADAAQAWLTRVRRLAAEHPVVAVPFADPDIVALSRRQATAEFNRVSVEDRNLLHTELGVEPITDLVWPAGEMITDQLLDSLVSQGVRSIVLDNASFPEFSSDAVTPNTQASLPALSGKAVGLVTDPALQTLIANSSSYSDGPRLAEQRYLAELAMITAEAPSRQRDLLIAPPRQWDPDTTSASAMLTEQTSAPWLAAGKASDLPNAGEITDRGPLDYPTKAKRAELSIKQSESIGHAAKPIADLRSALDNRAAQSILGPYAHALQRTASSAWRSDRETGQRYINLLNAAITDLLGKVRIIKPGNGIYSLASGSSPLVLTIANNFSAPVKIRIAIDSAGVKVDDQGVLTINARSRRTIRIPAEVQRSGTFVVNAKLQTPNGAKLGVDDGAPVKLKVRSTAYGTVALGITGAASALLFLLLLRRVIRRARRKRALPELPTPEAVQVTDHQAQPAGQENAT